MCCVNAVAGEPASW